MNADQLRTVVQVAINNALAEQTAQSQIREQALSPLIKTYVAIEIREDIQCNEPLDAVKCLPEFAGTQESYLGDKQLWPLTTFSDDMMAAPATIKRS